jgi:hypothetical protein
VAAWVSYLLYNFYLVYYHIVANNSTMTKAREKNKRRFGFLRFFEFFVACLAKFKNNQILLNKISRIFLLTTKLFTA